MSTYRRVHIEGGTYFFTVVTNGRQPILCNDNIRNALRAGIRHVQATSPFTIDGWVLLPDHIHCIWTLPPDDADFGARWAQIKQYVSKLCRHLQKDELLSRSRLRRNESGLWQRRFWEHQIRDERDFEMHMDYLHYNPVRHGYSISVREWPYSTFHRYAHEGIYSRDWGGAGVGDLAGDFGEPDR